MRMFLQLSKKGTVTLGPFGPEEPHQHDMSHANKLALLAYSKRAHSEWALLDKQEADLEKMDAQERKVYLAKLKVCAYQPIPICIVLNKYQETACLQNCALGMNMCVFNLVHMSSLVKCSI